MTASVPGRIAGECGRCGRYTLPMPENVAEDERYGARRPAPLPPRTPGSAPLILSHVVPSKTAESPTLQSEIPSSVVAPAVATL